MILDVNNTISKLEERQEFLYAYHLMALGRIELVGEYKDALKLSDEWFKNKCILRHLEKAQEEISKMFIMSEH